MGKRWAKSSALINSEDRKIPRTPYRKSISSHFASLRPLRAALSLTFCSNRQVSHVLPRLLVFLRALTLHHIIPLIPPHGSPHCCDSGIRRLQHCFHALDICAKLAHAVCQFRDVEGLSCWAHYLADWSAGASRQDYDICGVLNANINQRSLSCNPTTFGRSTAFIEICQYGSRCCHQRADIRSTSDPEPMQHLVKE